jgi:hypothetical protein
MSRLSQKPSFYPKALSEIDSREKIFIMKELGNKSGLARILKPVSLIIILSCRKLISK